MVSIIVPVYNVKEYIGVCLESLIDQSYSDIEIIVIDDGSTDGSGKICDVYAEKDNRIHVIHQENAGVSEARNKALSLVKGDFVGFVDADDYVAEDFIFKLYSTALNTNADIVVCGFFYQKEDDIIPCKLENRTLSNEEFYHDINLDVLYPFLWNKFFRTHLLEDKNGIRFSFEKDIYISEDFLYIVNIAQRAQHIQSIEDCLYYYRQRAGSAVNSSYNNKLLTELTARGRALDVVEKWHPKLAIYYKEQYYRKAINIKEAFVCSLDVSAKDEDYTYIKQEIARYEKDVLFSSEVSLFWKGYYLILKNFPKLLHLVKRYTVRKMNYS